MIPVRRTRFVAKGLVHECGDKNQFSASLRDGRLVADANYGWCGTPSHTYTRGDGQVVVDCDTPITCLGCAVGGSRYADY